MADTRFPSRRSAIALLALYLGALIGLGAAIWLEAPRAVSVGLLGVTLLLALLAAIFVGRAALQSQESTNIRERSSLSGRDIGVLTAVLLVGLAVACAKLVSPRTWPTTVDQALAVLDAQLDPASKRKLAYTGYDDLSEAYPDWPKAIREQFGLLEGNDRLLRDCDREYTHADFCSTVIISRYWKQVRAELPSAEREPLATLEKRMERVRLKPHEFEQAPLRDVVGFLNDAIRAQLPDGEQFTIQAAPADADQPVSASWHETLPISLREVLGLVAEQGNLRVKKAPPDVVIERQ